MPGGIPSTCPGWFGFFRSKKSESSDAPGAGFVDENGDVVPPVEWPEQEMGASARGGHG